MPGFWDALLNSSFGEYPRLHAMERAIWLGDMRGLPFWWVEAYRERGLLALLALSGQHVWALSLSLRFLLWLLWNFLPARGAGLSLLQASLIPGASWLLFSVSGLWSAARSAVAITLASLVFHLPLNVSRVHAAGGTILIFLGLNATKVAEPSLSLSLTGALLLAFLPRAGPFQYFVFCFLLPFWMAPLLALWFGKLTPLAFYYQIEVSWFWDGLLLPALFLVGLLGFCLPAIATRNAFSVVEMALEWGLQSEVSAEPISWFSAPSPAPLEALCLMTWLVAVSAWVFRRCRKAE